MSAPARLFRATAVAAVVLALALPQPPPPVPRHLVLVSLDTLRADHLGAYGYPTATSPVFDTLASRGILFERAVAQGPATLPSHGALFTGQYPSAYGDAATPFAVPAVVDTLPELLQRHGFATWGFTDGGFMDDSFGFAQGFERYEDQRVGLETTVRRLDAWMTGKDPQRLFLFVHCYDVHSPYGAPPEHRAAVGAQPWRSRTTVGSAAMNALEREQPPLQPESVAPIVSLYDAGIHHADALLGRLLDVLGRRGILDDALLVVFSDHGEEFFEHGMTQHKQIYFHPNLHVPLLFVVPGRPARRVGATVELIDVLPTVLELLGLPASDATMGHSLVPLIDGAPARDGVAYAEGTVWTASLRTVVTDRHQLLYDVTTGKARLYDHVNDPRARTDLAADEPALTARLVDEVKRRMDDAARRRTHATAPAPVIDEETRRDLKALGYVE
jgi:arylsulfatase A-like enzyme